jgi:hypothetical protein
MCISFSFRQLRNYAKALEWQRVYDAWSTTPAALAREFDARHPLRVGTGPSGVPNLAVRGPEHEVGTTLASKALWSVGNRANDNDPVARGDGFRLRPRSQQSWAPALIGPHNRLGSEGTSDTPVLARQHVHEPLAPCLKR